eukprot:5318153-Pyramimonas_sp.AAC.1
MSAMIRRVSFRRAGRTTGQEGGGGRGQLRSKAGAHRKGKDDDKGDGNGPPRPRTCRMPRAMICNLPFSTPLAVGKTRSKRVPGVQAHWLSERRPAAPTRRASEGQEATILDPRSSNIDVNPSQNRRDP